MCSIKQRDCVWLHYTNLISVQAIQEFASITSLTRNIIFCVVVSRFSNEQLSLTGLTMHGSRGRRSLFLSSRPTIVKAKIRKAFALLLGSILLQHAQGELIQSQNKCCAHTRSMANSKTCHQFWLKISSAICFWARCKRKCKNAEVRENAILQINSVECDVALTF